MLEGNKETFYPHTGTTKRVISGSFFTILGEGIGALKHILLIPLFLWAWGDLVYGEWITVYAFASYLPLVDMGMQNYIINRLTQSYSRGDLKEYVRIFQSALRLSLAIILITSILFLILVFLVPLNQWFNIAITNSSIIKITAFVLVIYLLLRIPFGLIMGLYHSFGQYPRRVMFANVYEIILISLLATALFFKSDFIIVSFLHFIPVLALVSYCLWDLRHKHKEVQFGFSSADWKLSLSFIGPGLLFLMFPLSNALKIQGGLLVIGNILGVGAVAIFSVHRTLANLISKVVNSINCAIWPELTAVGAREDYQKMQLAHNFLIKLSLFFSFSFAIFLFFTGKDIIRIWTHNRIEFLPTLWLLFLLYLPLTTFWETSGIFQASTNKYEKYSLARIGSAVLGIILAIILTKTWGIIGTLLGFIIAELMICGWLVPLETLKIIKANKKDFCLNTVGRGFIIILPQILIGWFLSRFVLNVFIQWILLALGVFFIGAVISYIFWLNKEEKQNFQRWGNLWKIEKKN